MHRKLASIASNTTLRTLYLMLLDFVESGIEEVVAGPSERPDDVVRRHNPIVERWDTGRSS